MTIENVLQELLGKYFSKVSEFCLDFIKRNQNEDGIRITFNYLKNLDLKTEKIAKKAYLLGIPPKTIQKLYDKLIDLDISPEKINTYAPLLSFNPKTIQKHYDKLIDLKISPQIIANNTPLLGRNPKTIQKNFDHLKSLGVSSQSIAKFASLLNLKPETIQDHFDRLRRLGISPQKINMFASLLYLNPETIQDHFDRLRRLGISPQKIAKNAVLLMRNPETIQDNYNYLINIIKLEEDKIQNLPILISVNPDAFVKKLRMFKLDILGLRRNEAFNPNEYLQFYLSSPATLLAKKNYCIDNRIDYSNNLLLLKRPWKRIIKRVDKTLSDAEADEEGRRITHPYKQRYDNWMKEYKKWCREFYLRRGRRLIVRV